MSLSTSHLGASAALVPQSIFNNRCKCVCSVILGAFGILTAVEGYRLMVLYDDNIRDYELKIIDDSYQMVNELDFHSLQFEVLLCIYSCFIVTFFNFISVWFKRPVYVCLYLPLCVGTATLLYFTA